MLGKLYQCQFIFVSHFEEAVLLINCLDSDSDIVECIHCNMGFVLNREYHNIIQIWTCDEGNMEFYGSETTILTSALPRSILLPQIHKTHIARHHRSIFASLYVKYLLFKHIGLWIHILLDSFSLYFNHFQMTNS